MENEIYSIDFSKKEKLVLYGTNQNSCVLFDANDSEIIGIFESFTDSVFFCRFLTNGTIFIATLDGTLSVNSYEDEINRVELQEDITFVDVSQTLIYVGTSTGGVYSFSLDLEERRIYAGHFSEISFITSYKDRVYTLSSNSYFIFDEVSCNVVEKLKIIDGIVHCNIPDTDVVVIGCPEILLVTKKSTVLNKISLSFSPESLIYADGYLLCGGNSSELIVLIVKENFKLFSINLDVEGISKITYLGNFIVAFSTFCGMIGIGDIRRNDGYKLYETSVGAIFDFTRDGDIYYVVGEKGIDFLDIGKIE